MKIFETPEMNISVFENTDIVTTSGVQTTAVDKAIADANDGTTIAGSAGTLSVDLW